MACPHGRETGVWHRVFRGDTRLGVCHTGSAAGSLWHMVVDKRTETVRVRVFPEARQAIEDRRGTWTTSEWVREAMKLAIKHDLRGPGPKKGRRG